MDKENKKARSRPDRANKHLIAAHIETDAYERFKALAEEKNVTTDMMVRAGLILLFKESGKPVPLTLYKKQRPALKKKENSKARKISLSGHSFHRGVRRLEV